MLRDCSLAAAAQVAACSSHTQRKRAVALIGHIGPSLPPSPCAGNLAAPGLPLHEPGGDGQRLGSDAARPAAHGQHGSGARAWVRSWDCMGPGGVSGGACGCQVAALCGRWQGEAHGRAGAAGSATARGLGGRITLEYTPGAGPEGLHAQLFYGAGLSCAPLLHPWLRWSRTCRRARFGAPSCCATATTGIGSITGQGGRWGGGWGDRPLCAPDERGWCWTCLQWHEAGLGKGQPHMLLPCLAEKGSSGGT